MSTHVLHNVIIVNNENITSFLNCLVVGTLIIIRPSVCLPVCLSVCSCVCLSLCLSVYLSVYVSVCLSLCLSVCVSGWLSVCVSVCLPVCLSVCLSVCLCVCLFVCSCVCLSVHESVRPSICLSVRVSVCLSVRVSVRPSICPCVCLSVCPCVYLSVRMLVCKCAVYLSAYLFINASTCVHKDMTCNDLYLSFLLFSLSTCIYTFISFSIFLFVDLSATLSCHTSAYHSSICVVSARNLSIINPTHFLSLFSSSLRPTFTSILSHSPFLFVSFFPLDIWLQNF